MRDEARKVGHPRIVKDFTHRLGFSTFFLKQLSRVFITSLIVIKIEDSSHPFFLSFSLPSFSLSFFLSAKIF